MNKIMYFDTIECCNFKLVFTPPLGVKVSDLKGWVLGENDLYKIISVGRNEKEMIDLFSEVFCDLYVFFKKHVNMKTNKYVSLVRKNLEGIEKIGK